MRRASTIVVASALAVLALAQPAATAPPPAPPDPSCSPGSSNCYDWHTSDVTVTWSAPPPGVTATGCGPATISSDTSGSGVSCTWSNAEGSRTTTVIVRRDATPPSVGGSPGRGPDANDWYNHSVGISFSGSDATSGIASCSSATYSGPDTDGTSVGGSCTDNAGNSGSGSVSLRYDATAPSVSASPERGPDANGWYNRALPVRFSGSDATSGIASCSSTTYSGPDAAETSVTGNCIDNAGNTGSAALPIKYDATPPSVEARAARKPDKNGWYNRPVTVSFSGNDAVSGVDTCVPPIRYRGPSRKQASLTGTCRDRAANTSPPAALVLKYDSKPPRLSRVASKIGARGVALSWGGSRDSKTYAVIRQPGWHGRKPSTVYEGRRRSFTDRRVRNGVTYRYTVTAYDEAGNGSAKVVLVKADSVTTAAPLAPAPSKPVLTRPVLRSPRADARLSLPPLLTWSPAPSAAYYNVQLYRNGVKILTVWPRDPAFRLARSWRYGGRTITLTPGRYRWYVWPGYGSPTESRYGKLIGSRWFVVTR